MTVFRRILVGVDGSEDSLVAAERATLLAQATRGHITFLFVVTEEFVKRSTSADPATIVSEAVVEQARTKEQGEEVLSKVREMASRHLGTGQISTKVRSGDPREEFVKELQEGGYELCVLGRRGASRSFETMFGKISEAIFSRTKVPLLIVRL